MVKLTWKIQMILTFELNEIQWSLTTRRSESMEEVKMLSCEMMNKDKEKQKSGSVSLVLRFLQNSLMDLTL